MDDIFEKSMFAILAISGCTFLLSGAYALVYLVVISGGCK
jgi:hypothetical protein